MAGRIPQAFVDNLISRIDIVDLIGRRVPLKRVGKEFGARCPFHEERTPSFTVSPQKQFYYCFGCGAHGTAIGFLMEYDRLEFVEAVEELARVAGVDMPTLTDPSEEPTAPLYRVLEIAAHYFQEQLTSHPAARKYLAGRSLSQETASHFGVGFAPPGWEGLTRHFSGQGLVAQAVQAGLLVEAEGRIHDRFRDRIQFPIRDRRGRIIGFGGRLLGEGKPKYLNSPETPLFHKGWQLYGLFEALQARRQPDCLILVEGYMDVLALAQAGIPYACATLGTATTDQHLTSLLKVTARLVFCFDGDTAGRLAAWKALQVVLPIVREGHEFSFLFLPQGEDPDSLLRREGREDFENRLKAALSLVDYLFQTLREGIQDLATLDGRAQLADQARTLITKTPEGIYRELLIQRLEQEVGLARSKLGATLAEHPQNRHRPMPGSIVQMTPVRRALAILLQYPTAAASPEVRETLDLWRDLDQPGIDLLSQLLEITQSQPTLSMASLLERWRDTDLQKPLERLATLSLEIPNAAGAGAELAGIFQRLNSDRRGNEEGRLMSCAKPSEMSAEDKTRLRRLLSLRQSPKG